jgi:flagellar L-ring protein precursor FlgH
MQTGKTPKKPPYGRIVMGIFMAALLAGCGIAAKKSPDPMLPPAPSPSAAGVPLSAPATQAATVNSTHSLWQQNSDFGTLFVNLKAHRVGDIVTIKIIESSSAMNQATTTTGRDSSIGIKTDKFFGLENQTADWNFNPLGELSAGFESDFEGEGATHRSGDLTAYITANVTEVLPNGNLRIMGNREVTINNEKQFISLSGVIRTRDISPQNEVLSTYIADAQIEYSGKGVVNDRQKPGWLTSLLNNIWPF